MQRKHECSRKAVQIHGEKLKLSSCSMRACVCHAVTYPDFGRKVHLIAVFKRFLDLDDIFEEFTVSFWAMKLTL